MEIPKRIRLRVVFENNCIFHIISTTNAIEVENWLQKIGTPYVNPNGLASIIMRSEEATKIQLNSIHCFLPYGNAVTAADALVENIKNATNLKLLFKQRY